MKKILITAFGFLCATTLVVSAQDATSPTLATNAALPVAAPAGQPAKKELTPEQKALRKELLEKYDTNKDGKLDKEERAAITSKEDQEKMVKARLVFRRFQTNLQ